MLLLQLAMQVSKTPEFVFLPQLVMQVSLFLFFFRVQCAFFSRRALTHSFFVTVWRRALTHSFFVTCTRALFFVLFLILFRVQCVFVLGVRLRINFFVTVCTQAFILTHYFFVPWTCALFLLAFFFILFSRAMRFFFVFGVRLRINFFVTLCIHAFFFFLTFPH